MNYKWAILGIVCVAVLFLLTPSFAFADTSTACTYNPAYYINFPAPGSGIISTVVANIANIVNNLAVGMYSGILSNADFQGTVAATITLYVIIYGVMFMGGLTQASLHDAVIRLAKIAVVATIAFSPLSWSFFYNYMGSAFDAGKNELIGYVLSIANSGVTGWTVVSPNIPPDSGGSTVAFDPQVLAKYPFTVLDDAVTVLTSSKMAVTLVATVATGPYGLPILLLILAALGTFVGALFQAMWVYLMSVVVTAFLFAIAPIFFVFLLFQRTRSLFDGWINQLISATLQPLFLFVFFSFFSMMMLGGIGELLQTPVCWTPPGDIWRGTPFNIYIWRFMVWINGEWRMHPGGWSIMGPDIDAQGSNIPVFPIGIADVLILLLIAQLAKRFNSMALHIAREIAGASLQLDVSMRLSHWFSPNNITSAFGNATAKAAPKTGGAGGLLDRLRGDRNRPGAGAPNAGGPNTPGGKAPDR